MDKRKEAALVFLEAAFAYLGEIAGDGICQDRTCRRCRIADLAFEVERECANTEQKQS